MMAMLRTSLITPRTSVDHVVTSPRVRYTCDERAAPTRRTSVVAFDLVIHYRLHLIAYFSRSEQSVLTDFTGAALR